MMILFFKNLTPTLTGEQGMNPLLSLRKHRTMHKPQRRTPANPVQDVVMFDFLYI